MKRVIFTAFAALFISATLRAASLPPPAIEWQRCYGTTVYHERLTTMVQTWDGGFLLGGTSSDLDDGYLDWFIVRLDAAGQQLWTRTFGGSDEDELESLVQTKDGGFILAGISSSPADGNKTSPFLGGLGDCWVVRLDANGNKLWDRSYGGSGRERLWSIRQTTDGGFVFAGSSSSSDGTKASRFRGGFMDGWIVRLDPAGDVLWERSFGGLREDELNDIQETTNGGFIAVGFSDSPMTTDKPSQAYGDQDFWVVALDASGDELWERSYGGSLRDFANRVLVRSDGGFVVVGASSSIGTGVTALTMDYWLFGLDAEGNPGWQSAFGGGSDDIPLSLERTSDGGYLLGGFSFSGDDGTKTSLARGRSDYWVVRVNSSGQKLWEQTYGGNEFEFFGALVQCRDGGFLLGGYSDSGVNGNKTATNLFGEDFWVLKLAPDAQTTPPRLRWESCCGEPGASYRLLLSGSSNLAYRTEFSSDLLSWTPLKTNLVAGSEVEVFRAPLNGQPQPHRFYRAQLLP